MTNGNLVWRSREQRKGSGNGIAFVAVNTPEHEWLWGWDETPGIVSVWAELAGQALVWRRLPDTLTLVCERERFRPWLVLDSLRYLAHVAPRRADEGALHGLCYEELRGAGALRYRVSADDGRALHRAVLDGAQRSHGRPFNQLRELGTQVVLSLPPEEQYLVASGRCYFRGLTFDKLRRLQFDLETTGLDPEHARVFLIALRDPGGGHELLEAASHDDAGEAALLAKLVERIAAHDPDVIENHNLHGFDLPFLAHRAARLGVELALGRMGHGLSRRPAARGARLEIDSLPSQWRRMRFSVPGRELIDSMDAVRRHDFAARDLPGHGLKAVARHLGLAKPTREYVPGARIYQVYCSEPERVLRYASDDVDEAEGLARVLGGAAFALAGMVPRRYERLADAGPATGVLDPLLTRAYLRAGQALPAHETGDGSQHSGAALYLFATGVAQRIVKADVASLYPSLMREYRIGPRRDRLGVLLALVDRLVELRLAAKARAKRAAHGSSERYGDEALSAAMKLVVNSAYGYLGATSLTRFSDVHAANEVTRQGRALLGFICRELARRGVTLLEADTDGVYFAVPTSFTEADERRVVSEVAALLPSKVQLEFEGRYAAMLSHEPKNYALLPYAGALVLRGVAFRSRRAEPFGEAFLREALAHLLRGDVASVRDAFVTTVLALRRRELPTRSLAARVRLTKTPEQYRSTRALRRELAYEALLGSGREHWSPGERASVYRALGKRAALLPESDDDDARETASDLRDYDVEHYVRLLRETFASRLARALTPEDFASVFADPGQLTMFERPLATAAPILTVLPSPLMVELGPDDSADPA